MDKRGLTRISAAGGGVDFAKLARDWAAQGLTEDGPEWTEALDDPALSREVLGHRDGSTRLATRPA